MLKTKFSYSELWTAWIWKIYSNSMKEKIDFSQINANLVNNFCK